MTASALPGRVLVVGSGLLGASLGMALRPHGVDVLLADRDPAAVATAVRFGAGRPAREGDSADLAVDCVPPESTGQVLVDLLRSGAAAYVTDVASVKALPVREVAARTGQVDRYVPGHPMAGREVSGARSALADLFEGRPWILCPTPATRSEAVAAVRAVALAVGALPITMPADEHDEAVALVSHAPHLVACLVAARLVGAPEREVAMAGPGIADVTRVAAGDPRLWTEILGANAQAVRAVLHRVRADLDEAVAALDVAAGGGDRTALTSVLERGLAGRTRLPGKHGLPRAEYAELTVLIEDRPGQLAALFGDTEAVGVNVEDVRIEHVQGRPTGAVELTVSPGSEARLARELRARGWTVHA